MGPAGPGLTRTKAMTELAEHNPEQRKRIIVTALALGVMALAFFASAFFFFKL